MAYSLLSYRERVIEHANNLGVKVTLTGDGIGKLERIKSKPDMAPLQLSLPIV